MTKFREFVSREPVILRAFVAASVGLFVAAFGVDIDPAVVVGFIVAAVGAASARGSVSPVVEGHR